MKKKKTIAILSVMFLFFLVVVYLQIFTSKSDRLTVTDIHDNVIGRQTTKKDLKEMYGTPTKSNNNTDGVNDIYKKANDYEGGISNALEDKTDFWSTRTSDKKQPLMGDKDKYDYYLEYQGRNLGINHVRFFFWRGTVYGIQFGNKITNESAAKRDKYLKQIYGD